MKRPHGFDQSVVGWFSAAGFLFLISPVFPQERLYVDDTANGANNGASWSDAFVDLQLALDAAEASGGKVKELWIAEGLYKPSKRTNEDDPRSATFTMVDGVAMYGGFAGDETELDQRPFVPTVLSGDLGEPGNRDDNAAHVLAGSGLHDRAGRLDGLTLQDGYVPERYGDRGGAGLRLLDSEYTLYRCTFVGNWSWDSGGGVYTAGGSLRLIECLFDGNWSDDYGAGLCNEGGSMEVERCLFRANTGYYGGGLYSSEHELLRIVECQFDANVAYSDGGAISDWGNQTVVQRCILSDNDAQWGGGLSSYSANVVIRDTDFLDNSADFDAAVELNGESALVEDCTFVGNSGSDGDSAIGARKVAFRRCRFVENRGAINTGDIELIDCELIQNNSCSGIVAIYGTASVATMTGCTFVENSTCFSAGIVWNRGNLLHMDGCRFIGNQAWDNRGTVSVERDGEALITDTLFAGNFSFAGGGAIDNSGCTTIANCTIVGNECEENFYGGIFNRGGCPIEVRNCVLWGNRGRNGSGQNAQIYGEPLDVHFTTLEGCAELCNDETFRNSAEYPLFADADGPDNNLDTFEDNNYRLGPFSPCADSGNNRLVPRGNHNDLDGHPRKVDDPTQKDKGKGHAPIVDRGAYERQPMPCSGGENVKRPRCRDDDGVRALTVRLAGGTSGDAFLIALSGGESRRGILDLDGDGKVKVRNVSPGGGVASVVWGCGATAERAYDCP